MNIKARNLVYASYRQNAMRKGISFELSRVEFGLLIRKRCYYCGSPGQNQFSVFREKHIHFSYNGIDRRNPGKGYNVDNCVPCCFVCNRAKARMTEEGFFSWLQITFAKALESGKTTISRDMMLTFLNLGIDRNSLDYVRKGPI